MYLWELFLHDQKHESWVDMAASPHCNPFPYMEAASRKPQQSNDTFSTVHDSYELLLLLGWWLWMQLSISIGGTVGEFPLRDTMLADVADAELELVTL